MNLQEEYALRHKLDIPLIQYNFNTCVLLRSIESPYSWSVIKINWHEVSSHPSYYILSWEQAIHNGFCKRLFYRTKESEIYCEEYETAIMDFVASLKGSFHAVPKSEHVFSLWKMFFYIYDSKFAGLCHKSKTVSAWMFSILADECPVKEKRTACNMLQSYLRKKAPSIHEELLFNIMTLSLSGSEWLVRLINE